MYSSKLTKTASMSLKETIGKNLAALRAEQGLTQEDTASYLGVNRTVINYYETAQREIPVLHLEKLADLFCLEVADLTAEKPSAERKGLFSFAFRTDGLSAADIQGIVRFQKVVKNYIKLKQLSHEWETSYRT